MSVSSLASLSLQSTPDLDLPEEVQQVESYLTWISKILSSAADTELNLDNPTAKRNYVTILLHKKSQPLQTYPSGEEIDENDPEDDDDVVETIEAIADGMVQEKLEHKYAEKTWEERWPLYISQKFNRIAMAVYARDYEFATKEMIQIRQRLDRLTGVHKENLFKLADYCINTLEWSIVKMQEKSPGKIAGENENNAEIYKNGNEDGKVKMFQEKWNYFLSSNKARAVIKYWRGNLERYLLPMSIRGRDIDLKILREVMEIYSGYYVWYHFAIKAQRLNSCKKNLEATEWCEKAFKLAPQVLVTNYDFALHLKDKFRAEDVEAARVGTADFDKCVSHFRTALGLATRYEMRYWTMKVESELGDLLASYSGSNVCIVEGVAMLRNCLERYQNYAFLNQKLARIYHHGVKTFPGGNCVFRDAEQAEYHYKRALQLKPAINYLGCLKGYLNLLPDLETPLTPAAVLALLTSSISFFESYEKDKRVVSSARLRKGKDAAIVRVWRACYLWQHDPEHDPDHKMKACEEWIAVLKKYLRHVKTKQTTLESICKPPFSKKSSIFSSYEMCTSDLKMHLQNIKRKANGDKDTLEAVAVLSGYIIKKFGSHTDTFTNQEHGNAVVTEGWLPRVDNANRQGQYWQGQNQRRGRFGNYGKGASKADMDDNWRA